jgi:predicted transcriptional regulator
MATTKIPLSDELQRQIEDAARDQHRQPSELLEEAVRQYLDRQSWVHFVQENERNARARRIAETDVDRLISEVRRENRTR